MALLVAILVFVTGFLALTYLVLRQHGPRQDR